MGLIRSGAPNITEILLEAGVVTTDQIDAALQHQRLAGVRIGEALVELGAASERDIGWALARQLGLTFLDLSPDSLDADLIRSFPEGVLRRLLAVPLMRTGPTLSVAFGDPTDRDALSELEHVAGLTIIPSVANPSMIYEVLDRLAERSGRQPNSAFAGHYSPPANLSHRATVLREGSGAHLLSGQIRRALLSHANEIHYLPEGDELRVYYRVGGRLVFAGSGPASITYLLLARLEALGGPSFDGEQTHIQGTARCPLGEQEVLIDVSLLMSGSGLAIMLGIRLAGGAVPLLDRLGFRPDDLQRVRGALQRPAGLVLVSGPARSGCSTTLASMLAAVPAEGRRSIAFERRNGVPMPCPTRMEQDSAEARAIWTEVAVAQDADILALDDVFSGGHVESLLSTHASGRLVLATTDWCDSFSLMTYLSAGPAGNALLADRLLLIVQQRLVHFKPDPDTPDADADRTRALFEVLVPSDSFRTALRNGATASELKTMAMEAGYRDLATQIHELVGTGRLPLAEAARVLS